MTNKTAKLKLKSKTYQKGATNEGKWIGTNRHVIGFWRKPKGETYEGQYAENKQNGLEAVQSDGVGKDHAAEVAQQPPVPSQERGAEEAPGVGAGAVQGREEAS